MSAELDPAVDPADPPARSDAATTDWLIGGGAMGTAVRAMDWSRTPLGAIASWPQSLRTTVSLCLASNFPLLIAWGPHHIQIYNDGYWPICGAKHPRSLGQNFRECWSSAWPAIGDAFERALTGETSFLRDQRVFLDRNGYMEETFFTFSFSPIRDESGGIGGLFHPVTEVTSTLLTQRRTRLVRELASRIGSARSVPEAFAQIAEALGDADLDLPFVLLFHLDPVVPQAHLVAGTRLVAGAAEALATVDLQDSSDLAGGLAELVRTGEPQHLRPGLGFCAYARGPYPEPPTQALALPITLPGGARPTWAMVAGTSARLPFDESYRSFVELVASTVTAAVANALAHEKDRLRAAQLAELDRAKTTFFNNVSHELRSPLTLMLGPIEDGLADPDDPLSPGQRQRQLLVRRNGRRVQKLVDTLLDLARIEGGRTAASFVPTDLSALTIDLASSFESLIVAAGLELVVDCQPLPMPVYVDPTMWEKVVSNLLSNAFKFTFQGGIRVALNWLGDAVELVVEDTGTGIPAHELPRVFDRFHRVDGARGRTHEGTGIGLALTHELIKLHGGSVEVTSVLGQGTTFTMSVPTGSAHLPPDRVSVRASTLGASRAGADSFLADAYHWDGPDEALPAPCGPGPVDPARPSVGAAARILLADDNADMRQYLTRLLSRYWTVDAVRDGVQALAAAQANPPDLILSDVMMPGLDGLSLARALGADPRTCTIPLVMLSARAGEEATIEGLDSGAVEYLVKPFSTHELLARIRAQLAVSQLRQDAVLAARAHGEDAHQLLEAARRAIRDREATLAIVSHDLRSPLAVITTAAELLQRVPADDQLPERVRKQAATIVRSAVGMNHLIADLLDLASIASGTFSVDAHPCTAAQLLREVGDLFQSRAVERGLTLSFDLEPELPPIACDSERILQVFTNLLSNALKFTVSGGIRVGAARRPAGVQFSIEDTGTGISVEAMKHIFDRYWHAPQPGRQGHGLGLSIVKGIVEAHGGSLHAESEVGRGSTFYFSLPCSLDVPAG